MGNEQAVASTTELIPAVEGGKAKGFEMMRHDELLQAGIVRESMARLMAYADDCTADDLRSRINLYAQMALEAAQELIAEASNPGAIVEESSKLVDTMCE